MGGSGKIKPQGPTSSTLVPSPAPRSSAVTGVRGRMMDQVKHPWFRSLESRRSRIPMLSGTFSVISNMGLHLVASADRREGRVSFGRQI
jgi:hypothetical protein